MQTVVETRRTSKQLRTCSAKRNGLTSLHILPLTQRLAISCRGSEGRGGKRRFGRSGMGKRGGARVVYLYGSNDYPIFLITVYAKAEKGNLSKAEQNALAKMAKNFFADYGRKL